MPVQTGIHNPVRHAGADRYPVFIDSWFPASAGKTRKCPIIYFWIPARPTPE